MFLLFVWWHDKGDRGQVGVAQKEEVGINKDPESIQNTNQDTDDPETERVEGTGKGLYLEQSLLYCCGWCLVFEGIFSALYHVCPSRLAFQFGKNFFLGMEIHLNIENLNRIKSKFYSILSLKLFIEI